MINLILLVVETSLPVMPLDTVFPNAKAEESPCCWSMDFIRCAAAVVVVYNFQGRGGYCSCL